MPYLWLKFIHVISSTILFGTGIGIASVMVYGHYTRELKTIVAINRYVVMADWVFTAPSAALQLITGLGLVYLGGYSYSLLWVWGSIAGYAIAAFCWFPVVYLQIKMRDLAVQANKAGVKLSRQYYRYFKYWFCLGWPAFISLLVVFYLMTNKPG